MVAKDNTACNAYICMPIYKSERERSILVGVSYWLSNLLSKSIPIEFANHDWKL